MTSIRKKKLNVASTSSANDSPPFSSQNSTDDVINSLSEDTFLGHKCEAVRSLLSMLHTDDDLTASEKFMQMTQHKEANELLRKNGCLKSIVQLIHKQIDVTSCKPTHEDMQIVTNASTALRQAVLKHKDESFKNKETQILSQLELLRVNVLNLRSNLGDTNFAKNQASKMSKIYAAMDTLQQLSYDEQYRLITLDLGGLQAIAETLIIDNFVFGLNNNHLDLKHTDFRCNIGAALTNLTFKSVESKSLLCNYPKFLDVLNQYVDCDVDKLKAISAGVLRNISFKADEFCRLALRNSNSAKFLIRGAMRPRSNLSAVRSALAALWNLSDFGFENVKRDICQTQGALEFLMQILRVDEHGASVDQRILILENATGVLRNISQYVASISDYRSIIRRCQGYEILLELLKSSSLTVVGNVCCCLWNLSAGDQKDGLYLLELGAQEALKGLICSKHKVISLGSLGTMKNLASLKAQQARTNSSSCSSMTNVNQSSIANQPGQNSPRNKKQLEAKNPSNSMPNSKTFPQNLQEKSVKISNLIQTWSNRQISSTEIEEEQEESMKIYVAEGQNCNKTEREFLPTNENLSQVQEDIIVPSIPPSRSEPNSKQPTTGLPTPMMYSRRSSMQSLDSCDRLSINSNVQSEYSQLPTGQQSPSDVPDSPTQQMPPPLPQVPAAPDGAGPSAAFTQMLMANDSYNFTRPNNYDMESLRAYKQDVDNTSGITEFSALTTESDKIRPLGRKVTNDVIVRPPATSFPWNGHPTMIRPPSQLLMIRPRMVNGASLNVTQNAKFSTNQNASTNATPSLTIQNLIRLGMPKQNGQKLPCKTENGSFSNPDVEEGDEEKVRVYVQEGPATQNFPRNPGRQVTNDLLPPPDAYFDDHSRRFSNKNTPSSSGLGSRTNINETRGQVASNGFFGHGSLPRAVKNCPSNSANRQYVLQNGRNPTNQNAQNGNCTVTPSLPIQKLIEMGLPKQNSRSENRRAECPTGSPSVQQCISDYDQDQDQDEQPKSYGEAKLPFVLDFSDKTRRKDSRETKKTLPLRQEDASHQTMASPLMQYCINLALPKAKKSDHKKSSQDRNSSKIDTGYCKDDVTTFGETSNLQDSLMLISTSSNLIKTNHSTLEKIKDAASLKLADENDDYARNGPPTTSNMLYNSESFSEDNYSKKSEEEDDDPQELNDFLTSENLEDETLTSEMITITNLQTNDKENARKSEKPERISKPDQNSSEIPAPKLIVRSTKTVDLRLQAQASSANNSRSGSPCANSRKTPASPSIVKPALPPKPRRRSGNAANTPPPILHPKPRTTTVTSASKKSGQMTTNATGVLRNISQYVASISDYRSIIRRCQGYEILLELLKSSSLTVVGNVCCCLWNLSAGDQKDGLYLLELGAQEALKGLICSKHKVISLGSLGTMKNLASLKAQQARTNSSSCSSITNVNQSPMPNQPGQNSPRNKKQFEAKNSSNSMPNSKTFPQNLQEKSVKISNLIQTWSNRQISSTEIEEEQEESMKIYVAEGQNCNKTEREFLPTNENGNQVQEDVIVPSIPPSRSEPNSKQPTTGLPTPMMYSRRSSMQSLDSCDRLSINSNVQSEYSQLPTGQQSPSDVPDSPTQQMPPALPQVPAAPDGAGPSAAFTQMLMANDSYNFTRPNNYDMESLRAYKQDVDNTSGITQFSALTTESDKIRPLGRKVTNDVIVRPAATFFPWNGHPTMIRPPSQLLMIRPRMVNGASLNVTQNAKFSTNQNASTNATPSLTIQNLIRLGMPKQNGQKLPCKTENGSYSNPDVEEGDEEKVRVYVQEGPATQNFPRNPGRQVTNDLLPPPDAYFDDHQRRFSNKNTPSSSGLGSRTNINETRGRVTSNGFFGHGSLPRAVKNCPSNSANRQYVLQNGRNSTNQNAQNGNCTVTPSLPIQKLIEMGLPKQNSRSENRRAECPTGSPSVQQRISDYDQDQDQDEQPKSYGEAKLPFVLDFSDKARRKDSRETKKTLPLRQEDASHQTMASPLMQYCINLALPKAKKSDHKKSSQDRNSSKIDTGYCKDDVANFGEPSNLQDSLMLISTSSNLIKTNHSTLEKIKDAASLKLADENDDYARNVPPATSNTMYNSESFSEDNYSKKSDEDDDAQELVDFLTSENLEDETLTSEMITITNLQVEEANDQENVRKSEKLDRISKPGQHSSEIPAPKLIVRSTKTVDLRLQAQASSANNSRSGSPCANSRKTPASPSIVKPALPPKPRRRSGNAASTPPPILHPKPRATAAVTSASKKSGQMTTI